LAGIANAGRQKFKPGSGSPEPGFSFGGML
jgi:hypothetical protein